MKIKIFVQSELLEDIEILELSDDAGTDELHKACIGLLPSSEDASVFNLYVEDDDDELTINNLVKIPDGLCVHLHRLKGIDVKVRYAGRDVQRTFRPSATVGRVKKWSSHELGISQSDAAELMLQISGSDIRPDTDIHIGTLVKSPTHSICFDLIPSPRVNGCTELL